jgi:putative PIN family toxin of toxin-antitoxin system
MKNWKRFDVSENPRVVFDTQVYLRAFINSSSACGRLFSTWSTYYILLVTDAIEDEIVDVFSRPKIRAKFPQINNSTLERVKAILHKAERVTITAEDIEAISRDPKDDIFLACAKVAEADYLVSEDNDLLVLTQYHGTKIVNVVTFLTVLESRKNTPPERPE